MKRIGLDKMVENTGYDEPMHILYKAEGGPYGYYRLIPICPRCKDVLFGDEKRCPYCNQKFIWREESMTDFTEFVVKKFSELSEKFAKKNGQYAVSADPLANFSTGARLKYGKAGMPEMYETLKDYARKHISYVATHGIDGKTLQDSLEDIAVYSVIALYMRACYVDFREDNEDNPEDPCSLS